MKKQTITKEKVIAMMVKWGSNPQDAERRANVYFSMVMRCYAPENVAQAADAVAGM